MGADAGPKVVVDGAEITRVRCPDVRFLMFGDQSKIAPLLEEHPDLKAVSEVRHTDSFVSMEDKPAQAIRKGRDTSMWHAIGAVQNGEADVVVSAGNTGALMAMAKIQLRTMAGVDRPAIAALWPTERGESVVLDVGANVDSDERQLVTFAIMGEAFARAVFGLKTPLVGVLNIGSEELKGNDAVKGAAQILQDADLPIKFYGFVEGNDIGAGTVDVVVTDGFTGNVALKTAEGTARLISHYLSTAIRRSFFARIGYLLAAGAFNVLRAKMDPRSVNGGVFLGLNGLVVKSHGGTDAMGMASAIELAHNMISHDLVKKIEQDVTHLYGSDDNVTSLAQAANDEVSA